MSYVSLNPVNSIKADFSDDQTYVLKLATAPLNGQVVVAAALSNHRVKLYGFDGTSLKHVGDLNGHRGVITDLIFPIEGSPDALLTSSQDGTVRMWDARAMSCTATYSADGYEVHCSSVGRGGNCIAAGSDAAVLFWDRRTTKPMGSFQDSFAEAVTQVKFYPGADTMVLAGDVDGLCCVFDTSGPLTEDAGFRACANIGTSVAEMGFFGPSLERVWLRSTTETLHLWEWAAAMNENGSEGAGELRIDTAREQCSAVASAAGFTPLAQTDYLIGCEYNPTEDSLYLLAGSSEGAAGAFRLEARAGALGETEAGIGPLVLGFAGGHEEVVRSVLWPLASGHHVISGAEDSRVIVWGPMSGAAAAAGGAGPGGLGGAGDEEEAEEADIGKAGRAGKSAGKALRKPY